jgi:hypothetical protein
VKEYILKVTDSEAEQIMLALRGLLSKGWSAAPNFKDPSDILAEKIRTQVSTQKNDPGYSGLTTESAKALIPEG